MCRIAVWAAGERAVLVASVRRLFRKPGVHSAIEGHPLSGPLMK